MSGNSGTLTANNNIAIGDSAGNALTGAGGISNVLIGQNAGSSITTGAQNVVIGSLAGGATTTGNFNIVIGQNAGGSLGATSGDVIAIGSAGGSASNSCWIGNITGATVGASATVLVNASDQLGTVVSSRRFKENIKDMGDASDFLYKLRPVRFTLKSNPEWGQQTGLIAEEVLEVAPQLVVHDREGEPQSIAYHELPALLLNELQKLRKEIDELKGKL
jgi:hypothetical protein